MPGFKLIYPAARPECTNHSEANDRPAIDPAQQHLSIPTWRNPNLFYREQWHKDRDE